MNKEKTKLNNKICKICGFNGARLYCSKEDYDIIKCPICGCGFLDLTSISFKPYEFYQAYYRGYEKKKRNVGYDDYFSLEKALRFSFRKRLNLINRYINDSLVKKKLLDIGCGPGFFLKEASRNYDVCGVELSPIATDYAKNNLNLNVVNASFHKDIFETDKFDVVTLWDTLEHMDNPKLALLDVASLLKKNGILAFTTGDFQSFAAKFSGRKWHLFNIPEHLFFFSKKAVECLLKKNGFKILYLGYDYSFYSLSYLIERASKSLGLHKKVRKFSENKVLNKIILPFNLFDIMLVIAKKL